MRATRGHEPRGGGRELELKPLAFLAAHFQRSPFIANPNNDSRLKAPAKMRDARAGTDAGNWTGRAER